MGVRLNHGRNRIRTLEGGDVAEIAAGTGTTAEDETQTGLAAELIRKAATFTAASATGHARFVMRLLVGEANGNDLTEVALVDNNGGPTTRHVFAAIAKDSGKEVEFRVTSKHNNP